MTTRLGKEAATGHFENVTITSVCLIEQENLNKEEQQESDDSFFEITFDNGRTLQGPMPFSALPLYTYTVDFQEMERATSQILGDIEPKRLPLNYIRLCTLIKYADVKTDLDPFIMPNEFFDISVDAPDQTENLFRNFPDLAAELVKHFECILYFRFEDCLLLKEIYTIKTLRLLTNEALKKTATLVRNDPMMLAFKTTKPSMILPEIDEDTMDHISSITGHNFTGEERAGIKLYTSWLKKDMQYGHTVSRIRSAKHHCPCADLGIKYLLEKKIIFIEGEDVNLTSVLLLEDSMRQSFDTLMDRQGKDTELPKRDEKKDPYDKEKELVELDTEQQKGLQTLIKEHVGVLCGKAGTGKTALLAHIVKMHPSEFVLGAAPTNRAAIELTRRVVKSKTIHRLIFELVDGSFEKPEKVHIVIIDESSMIPLDLAAYMAKILTLKCRNLQKMYFVGDIGQLESIGAGAVLRDLAKCFPTVFLEKNHRVSPEAMLIHENSVLVRDKNPGLRFDNEHFLMIESADPANMRSDLAKAIQMKALTPWNTHILSPYRNGANDLARSAKELFTNKSAKNGVFCLGEKILCTKNYHNAGLVNGDFLKVLTICVMGLEHGIEKPFTEAHDTSYILGKDQWFSLIVTHAPSTKEQEIRSQSAIPFSVNTREIPLSSFTFGYATTNHKYQGSEADNLIFYMPTYSTFVNWKHVYTAITRARQNVIIISTKESLTKAITAVIYPRRTKLFSRLGFAHKIISELMIEPENEEIQMRQILREISVETKEESDYSSKKRQFSGNDGGSYKKART